MSSLAKKLSPSIKTTDPSSTKIQVNPNLINKVTISKIGDQAAINSQAAAIVSDKASSVDESDSSQQFYIEVDASTAASLKAGTQYTLIPMNDDNHPSYSEETVDIHIHDSTNTDVKGMPFIQPKIENMLSDEPPGPMAPKALPVKESDSPTPLDSDVEVTPDISIQTQEEMQYASQSTQVVQPITQESVVKEPAYAPLTTASHIQTFSTMLHTPCFHHPHIQASSPLPPLLPPTPHPSHHLSHLHNPTQSGMPSSHSTPVIAYANTPIPSGRGRSRTSVSSQLTSPSWTPYPQGFHPQTPYFRTTSAVNNNDSGNSSVLLNSSGEEQSSGSPDYPKAPHNTPMSGDSSASLAVRMTPISHFTQVSGPLDNTQYYVPVNGRETHNEKERKRRGRIKSACDTLRSLIPGLSDKTDKATVFEYTVQYLMHLRRNVGMKYDKEFIERYSPY